jgi:hypothetical protein
LMKRALRFLTSRQNDTVCSHLSAVTRSGSKRTPADGCGERPLRDRGPTAVSVRNGRLADLQSRPLNVRFGSKADFGSAELS